MNLDNRTIDETNIHEVIDITPQRKNVIMDSQILTTIMNCARLTDFRFNMNLKSIKGNSNSLEIGSIIHTYFETYYKSVIKGLDKKQAFNFGITAAELYIRGCPDCTNFEFTPEFPKPKCGHKLGQYPGIQNTPIENESYKTGWKWALATCEQYFEHYKNDSWVPLEVEVVKSKVLYQDDDLRILWKSKLDLIVDTNQGILPVDHKTMKQRRQTGKLNNQFIGQCLNTDSRNVIIDKVGLQTTLKPEDKFIREVISYSSEQLIEWSSQILPYYANKLIEYAEGGYWPPNYTNCEGKYGPCPFQDVCGSNPSMREDELKMNFIVGQEWNPVNDED